MTDTQKSPQVTIISSLRRAEKRRMPKATLERLLREQHPGQGIAETLQQLLDAFQIDFVIDCGEVGPAQDAGEMIWYAKLLTPKDRKEIESLPPVNRALLRILQQTAGQNIGEIPVEEAEELLRKQGFAEAEAKHLSIEDWIKRVESHVGNKPVSCYRLVPEYEKTEEYKREKKAQDLEWIRMDMERQASFDKLDDEAERRLRRRKKKK